MSKHLFIILLLCFTPAVFAQDVSFTASAPSKVPLGKRFTITYTLNTNSDIIQINSPKFDDFAILGGPIRASMQGVISTNNQTTYTYKKDFTYYLRGNKKGTFTIPPASCDIDGKTYRSNGLVITIFEESGQAQAPQTPIQTQENQTTTPSQKLNNPSGKTEKIPDLRPNSFTLKASANKTTAYLGEEILLTYKLYAPVAVDYSISKIPASKGVWIEELDETHTPFQQYSTSINGETYYVAEIRKVILFPQEVGTIQISPFEIIVSDKKKPENLFDLFWEHKPSLLETVKSNSLSIQAKKLPKAPEQFTGGVGDFSIQSKVDKSKLKAHQALKYSVTLSGKGNLMLIDKLSDLRIPEELESYDPEISSQLSKDGSDISGNKTFEWLIIPRLEGTFEIPALHFIYFDPKIKRYQTIQTNKHTIEVEKGDPNVAETHVVSSIKEIPTYNDILFIKIQPSDLKKKDSGFFRSALFYILFFIFILSFFVGLFLWKPYMKKRGNLNFMKLKQATHVAHKRFHTAELFLNEGRVIEFYEDISNGLWGYLSDKFSIPRAGLSIDSVQDALQKKGLDLETIHHIKEMLSTCEFARFAPGSGENNEMDVVYKNTLQIIENIENQLKQK